jgi:release factor glutamine methyltransferase
MISDPAQDYARGYVPFLDCTIFLDSHPLIPRPETEYWTEQAILEIKKKSSPGVLDLFAGSGAIGIAVLKHVPNASVDFGELVSEHLSTIQKNIRENGIEEARAHVFKTDVLSDISGVYDFILANPPYIAEDATDVDESVLAYEPYTALFAKNGGFDLIEKTINGARECLAPDGALYLEHRPEQAEQIAKTAAENGFSSASFPDHYGVIRYSILHPL